MPIKSITPRNYPKQTETSMSDLFSSIIVNQATRPPPHQNPRQRGSSSPDTHLLARIPRTLPRLQLNRPSFPCLKPFTPHGKVPRRQNADQVSLCGSRRLHHRCHDQHTASLTIHPINRVRTLTGKEIELDIEPDYKVRPAFPSPTTPTASR